MPLIISLRFLRALGLVKMFVTLPKLVGVAGFQVMGAPSELDRTRSRARTLVDSGGSCMWDASVGRDHKEGEEPKIVVDEWERIEPKYILRWASDDVRVYVVDEPEWVTLEEVLGRGGGDPASLSSSGGTGGGEAGEEYPVSDGRLSFHVEPFAGVDGGSMGSGRMFRWMEFTVERLDPRL